MSSPIVNPEIPYNGDIPGGLQPGKMCRIQGVTHPNADRFNINLQTGPNAKPRDDTALHISVRLNQGYVARNTYKGGEWGDEQGRGSLPIGTAQSFEILILVEPSSYKIAINGQHFCDFSHIIPYGDVTHLLIDGDVSITVISWEASAPVLAETLSQASQLNAQQQQGVGPQEAYGPPPGGYAPQGQFGPQGGYGPPPPGYGPPPPPGAEPQSGLDSFLEQAQSVLAGAIKSGAAEKLLGGLLSSGGNQQPPQGQGYTPQNAQYGIYPQLPQDEFSPKYNQNEQNRGPGPVESFISSLLLGGNTAQQQPYQQTPQPMSNQPPQQSQCSPLASFLAGLLAPGNKQQQPQQYDDGAPHPPQQFRGGAPHPPQQFGGGASHPPGQNVDTNDLSDVLADLIAGRNVAPQQPQNQTQAQNNQPQQQYGQYPLPPQQPHQQEQRGPIESLLSGFLSGGGGSQPQQQQQPHMPQVGGEGSIGGLGSMGGLLTNFAGQLLHKPRDN